MPMKTHLLQESCTEKVKTAPNMASELELQQQSLSLYVYLHCPIQSHNKKKVHTSGNII